VSTSNPSNKDVISSEMTSTSTHTNIHNNNDNYNNEKNNNNTDKLIFYKSNFVFKKKGDNIFGDSYDGAFNHFSILQKAKGIILKNKIKDIIHKDKPYFLIDIYLIQTTSSIKDFLIKEGLAHDYMIDEMVKLSGLPPINYPNSKDSRLYQVIFVCSEEDLSNIYLKKCNKKTDFKVYKDYISFYKEKNVFNGYKFSTSLEKKEGFFLLTPEIEQKLGITLDDEDRKFIYDLDNEINIIVEDSIHPIKLVENKNKKNIPHMNDEIPLD
jgi:hypothetical protein